MELNGYLHHFISFYCMFVSFSLKGLIKKKVMK